MLVLLNDSRCCHGLVSFVLRFLFVANFLQMPSMIQSIRILPTDVLRQQQQQQRRQQTTTFIDHWHRHLRRSRTNSSVPNVTNPDHHLVKSLPLLEPGTFTTNHWAGLLPASPNHDKYFFYWLFAPNNGTQSS